MNYIHFILDLGKSMGGLPILLLAVIAMGFVSHLAIIKTLNAFKDPTGQVK